ncbi:Membrane protein insertase YidC [Posidoniimonas polymericola]|uniref:Membrane protein insertase YidC n=1 Tax=Posidoniimonas polymericola TaxID=2528002 RepID=A0A5C5YQJ2_9BACT|nr:membrane protein insertase YidC [Posidoniimonas polymericola]TWT77068.1 Membrane protein insertase YidC [Posidoniimonas polymericola]
MRRSPADPRQPQDQRLFIFLLLAASIAMFWSSMNPQPPVQPADQAAAEQGDDAQAEGNQADSAPAPDRSPGDPATAADAEGDDQAAGDAEGSAPEVEEVPLAEPQNVLLGSASAEGPYRMLMTLTNEGAAIRRIVLSSDEITEIDNHHGSLGVQDFSDVAGGVRLDVVGPGTVAHQAGLRSGDVVVGSGDSKAGKFATAAELLALLEKTKPGDKLTLQVAGDEPRTVEATLGRPPLELVRPERENILLHQDKLPAEYEDVPSLLVQLVSVNDQAAKNAALIAANERLKSGGWTVSNQDAASTTFTMRLADLGLEVAKTFTLAEVPSDKIDDVNYRGYHFDFSIEVRNLRDTPQEVVYELQGPNGLPIEGYWYANKIGRNASGGGAWGAVGLRDVITRFEGSRNLQMSPSGIVDGDYERYGDGSSLAYIGVDAQYFSMMLIPQKQSLEEIWFDYANTKLATPELGKRARVTLNNPTFTLTRTPVVLAAAGDDPGEGTSRTDTFTVFAGPKRPDLLAQYQPADADTYTLQGTLYYGWFDPVARLMLAILHTFYAVVRNYGVSIVLLTVLVRLCMFPISRKQATNMVKMQELKPEIDRIAEKYKDDMPKRTQAQQELFRKHNFHPMGGCLPMFFQLPIFLGLYRALAVDVELREASLLGDWTRFCSNLAAPDMFFDWSAWMPQWVNNGFLPSFMGIFAVGPYFNLLPVVTVCLFLLQQKLFMPEATTEQAILQQKMMKYMMGFMGLMFFKVPSGLCIYFITSSLWGIAERKLVPPPKPAENPAAFSKPDPPKRLSNAGGGGTKKKSNNKKKKR